MSLRPFLSINVFPLSILVIFPVALGAGVSYFNIVNADTGKIIYRLSPNQNLSVLRPFNIVAVTKGKVSRVVFTRPYNHVSTKPPFTLPLPLMHFSVGKHSVSAYINNRISTPFSTMLLISVPDMPRLGPQPSMIEPTSYLYPAMKRVGAPLAICPTAEPKDLILKYARSAYYFKLFDKYEWDAVNLVSATCPEQLLRCRILSIRPVLKPNGTRTYETTVLKASVSKGYTSKYLSPTCQPADMYIESCLKDEAGQILCRTTALFRIPRQIVPEPRLKFRSPYVLKIVPGSRARVKTVIHYSNARDGFHNGLYEIERNFFALTMVAISRHGIELARSKTITGNTVSLTLGGKRNGVSKASFDGATVFLEYRLANCTFNSDSYRRLYPTKLVVNDKVDGVLKRDIRLPSFNSFSFPVTLQGKTAVLRVRAQNSGAGRLRSGKKTVLTYQWLIRTQDLNPFKTYARLLQGETRPTLTLKNLQCTDSVCGENGCEGDRVYYVDVCNTLGCKRSQGARPIFKAPVVPEGKCWNKYHCLLYDQDPGKPCAL